MYISGQKAAYYDVPLIIVDGEKMPSSFDTSTINPENIDSITILKGKKAVKDYGEDARSGAIIIYLKQNQK